MDEFDWLAVAPWLAIPEWAGFMYVDRTTVSRQVTEWTKEGLIVCRYDGRLVRPRNRFLLSTAGLDRRFPEHHTHPGPDGHTHDPLDNIYAHDHPNYFNGHAGAIGLYQRLELIETWYPLAPKVLQGEGAAWTDDGRARNILSWRWLRNTRLIHAVATYEDDYKIGFCHIGRSITFHMLRWRWENRFPDDRNLAVTSRGEVEERRRGPLDPPNPDLDYNPQLSGYVITTPDYRGAELAVEALPRGHAYLYVVGPPGGLSIYRGRAAAAPHDDVSDRFEDVNVGIPQDLCL